MSRARRRGLWLWWLPGWVVVTPALAQVGPPEDDLPRDAAPASSPAEGAEEANDSQNPLPEATVERSHERSQQTPPGSAHAEPPATHVPTGEEPRAPDAAAGTALPEGAATSEELEESLLASVVTEAGQSKFSLDLYGFADFTYSQGFGEGERGNFFVGRLNVYLAADLGDRFRSLVEVRFSYLPHGAQDPSSYDWQDNSAGDYTDLNRAVRVGGVIIERAFLEYSAHPLANLRAGHFLTPYGIWNVDHGSPVIIGSRRPYVIGERIMPEWQTGFQLYGSHLLGRMELGYNLTLSNGRGPLDMYLDLDANKGMGGRIYANFDTDYGEVALGLSSYTGKYTDASTGPFGIAAIRESYDELAFAADAKWTYEQFLVQAEIVSRDVVYAVRPSAALPLGLMPDHREWGMYALGGYRFDWFGVMPFVALDFHNPGPTGFAARAFAFWGGLNVRPTPRVVFKAQYTHSWHPDPGPWQGFHYNSLDCQVAWSF